MVKVALTGHRQGLEMEMEMENEMKKEEMGNKENEVVESESASAPASAPVLAPAPASASASASAEDESRRIGFVCNSTHFVFQVDGGPKGFGLKRWRRIKRDSCSKDKNKDEDPITRLLKRSSSPDNMDANANASFSFAPIFTAGPADSDNSDDRSSSKSSTAATATAPKSKHRLKSLTNPKPNSHSSTNHHPHPPSFLFQPLPFTTTPDPLVTSIHMLRSAQIALHTEVERFKELGKEFGLLCDESNEKDSPFDGCASELNHMYSNKNVGTLETRLSEAEGRLKEREMKIVELEEAIKNMSPSRESKRWQDMEAELDSILEGKIEAEIEHLLITRCSKDLSVLVEGQMKLMREQKGVGNERLNLQNNDVMPEQLETKEEEEENIMSMRRKALSSAKCFGIQLSLLLLLIALLISRLTPKSAVVVPT